MKKQKGSSSLVLVGVLVLVVLAGMMFGLPMWGKWRAGVSGQAELDRATFNRQIATLEAKQQMESAEYLNQAEIIRARGVAAANKIVADGLGGPEGYLRYLWIQGLSQGTAPQVIYVPTEQGLPILEAGKR